MTSVVVANCKLVTGCYQSPSWLLKDVDKNSHTLHIFLAPQKTGHCTASDIVADSCTLEELPTALC